MIIDNDLARETYWSIIESYDYGSDVLQEHPFENERRDDVIYIAAYALAFWEIGLLTPLLLQEVERVIKMSTSGVPEKDLARLWKKISAQNGKPRVRTQFRKIRHFIFHADTLYAYGKPDGQYGAVICIDVTQSRGDCCYMFVPATYNDTVRPTVDANRHDVFPLNELLEPQV